MVAKMTVLAGFFWTALSENIGTYAVSVMLHEAFSPCKNQKKNGTLQ